MAHAIHGRGDIRRTDWNGRPAKLMLWANRNGFFYVLDHATGAFLSGTPDSSSRWSL